MSVSDVELSVLLAGSESDRVEFKESLGGDAPKKLRQAICAFANDLPDHRLPSYAIIGVNDAGQPTGLAVTDALLLQLADIKTDGNIVPSPSFTVEKRVVDGQEIAVVAVLPSDSPPVRYEGRIWIRTGPRRALANKQDERILNEKRRFKDLPFDLQPVPNSAVADLDLSYFETEYLPAIIAPDVLSANDRTPEQKLTSAKLIDSIEQLTPTVLAHLTIGFRCRDFLAGNYIQFLKLDGFDLASPIIDDSVIDGQLSSMLRQIEEKFRAHNYVSVDIQSADKEIRTQTYPLVAFQQVIRNAIMHRTYENTNAPVRVSWFSDRIEIWSPGGPYGTVTQSRFGQPGYTDYRNPNLAEAMHGLGLVQRFGVGIATATNALKSNGNPAPEFETSETAVNVVLRK
jgi:ATP-dependent DNA helicase RecG